MNAFIPIYAAFLQQLQTDSESDIYSEYLYKAIYYRTLFTVQNA